MLAEFIKLLQQRIAKQALPLHCLIAEQALQLRCVMNQATTGRASSTTTIYKIVQILFLEHPGYSEYIL